MHLFFEFLLILFLHAIVIMGSIPVTLNGLLGVCSFLFVCNLSCMIYSGNNKY